MKVHELTKQLVKCNPDAFLFVQFDMNDVEEIKDRLLQAKEEDSDPWQSLCFKVRVKNLNDRDVELCTETWIGH